MHSVAQVTWCLVFAGGMTLAGAISGAAAAQAPAAATRAEFAGVSPRNLQVLPTDTPMADVLTRMDIMVEALGVNCGFCHTYEKPGSAKNDFAADGKATKQTARMMMGLDDIINGALRTGIKKPAEQVAKVRCITCHRGAPIPYAASTTVSPRR